jgi:uncharacterized protein (DUF433 family)
MSIQLKPEDRNTLQRFLGRKWKPTSRQKALALLRLATGESLETVSSQLGIKKADLAELVARFSEEGLAGIGLNTLEASKKRKHRPPHYETIVKTPGVCGGAARVADTRIPVWQLVEARDLGVSEAQLLLDFPALQALNLAEAWKYAKEHPDEIATEIHENQVA